MLAKSQPPLELLQHSREVAEIALQLRNSLPQLSHSSGWQNFFELLFAAAHLHDWGKVHSEFQKKLRGENHRWQNRRHEIFSVPFVDTLNLSAEQIAVVGHAILAHHKNFAQLSDFVVSEKHAKYLDATIYDFLHNFRSHVAAGEGFSYLKRLQQDFARHYQQHFAGNLADFRKMQLDKIEDPLSRFVKGFSNQMQSWQPQTLLRHTLLLGALKICDHLASAGIADIHLLQDDHFHFLQAFTKTAYQHQHQSWQANGHLLLVAPTGSGKTEAALGWAKRQLRDYQGRIYYILPYTASINAMYSRLKEYFEPQASIEQAQCIGLLHGRVDQCIAALLEQQCDPQVKYDKVKAIKALLRQMVLPLKVATPFQVLKYLYGVKRFEMGIAELSGAILLFDEIHAYDVETLARIIAMLEWLQHNLRVRVMVMTATLPTFIKKLFIAALQIDSKNQICAPETLLAKFTRHRIHVVPGAIFDQVDAILQDLQQGKKVLVVCNTVRDAQQLALTLREQSKSVLLIHSRFTTRDRIAIEGKITEKMARGQILIGTQAIEVSLDIDYDVLYTQPAPIDALLQRMGRVNRKREKGICPVFVCRASGELDHYIYPADIVAATLDVLEKIDIVDEKSLQDCIDAVYPSFNERQQQQYDTIKQLFGEAISRLNPFFDTRENEQSFYEQFTGIQVLPARFYQEYKQLIEHCDWIAAEGLMVTIHQGLYHKLKGEERLIPRVIQFIKSEDIYQHSCIIAACEYDDFLGMTDEFAAIDDAEEAFL